MKRRIILLLVSIAILLIPISSQPEKAVLAASYRKVYLPMVFNSNSQVLLGLYAPEWLGVQSAIDTNLNAFSDWSGKKITFAGTFIGLGDQNYEAAINMQFDQMYKNGYTPFVNLMGTSTATAADIASGKVDKYLTDWATWYAKYARNGERMAYIAPFPEMNGEWTPYGKGLDHESYKLAYRRVQQKFYEAGVPKNTVKWVFAPNGDGDPFEKYYPGDDVVDAVGFSTYNYAFCYNDPRWHSLKSISQSYIDRFKALAPTKPIFITQMASASLKNGVYDTDAKNQWFRDSYNYIANESGVRAVIYFNYDDDAHKCDTALYRVKPFLGLPQNYTGYRDAVSGSKFKYISPNDLINTVLAP